MKKFKQSLIYNLSCILFALIGLIVTTRETFFLREGLLIENPAFLFGLISLILAITLHHSGEIRRISKLVEKK